MKALEDESLLTKEVQLVKVEYGGPATHLPHHNLGTYYIHNIYYTHVYVFLVFEITILQILPMFFHDTSLVCSSLKLRSPHQKTQSNFSEMSLCLALLGGSSFGRLRERQIFLQSLMRSLLLS